ncbi:MAG: HSP90 family protein [Lachnospiraceae bacterium]|nr:HSP90 family protein [Lachnospiraceae bacterium]
MDDYRFQVNLGGMIEILSDHLYSSPGVFIRELLQNGVDAIVARTKADTAFDDSKGRLLWKIEQRKNLTFTDNGSGLTREEIHRFLAIIGESSKRDLESGRIREEYIGRFGIGLLSCFMVSNRIVVRTRSCHGNESLEWKGNPDGTYSVEKLDEELPVGTSIYLEAKAGCEDYFETKTVIQQALHYGALLPYEICLDDGEFKGRLNPLKLPWEEADISTEDTLHFGEVLMKERFLDAVPLRNGRGEAFGVAYILNRSVAASTKQQHMIYLKHMLLTEKGDAILPEWAVFVRCILNVNHLRPTASREGFYEDEALEEVRGWIADSIIRHLKRMAKTDEKLFGYFMELHDLAIRSMAVDNDELFDLFADYLDFVTTRGVLTGLSLRLSKEDLLYAGEEEYKQLSQIFTAQNRLLINISYVYSYELLLKICDRFGMIMRKVAMEKVDEILLDVSAEAAEECVDFLALAEEVLLQYGCHAQMKRFMPANLPAFYFLNREAVFLNDLRDAKEGSDEMFGGMLDNFAEEVEPLAESTLYFNWSNPLVRKMVEAGNTRRTEDLVTILYVQTLLIGGFRLRNNELGIMNEKLMGVLLDDMGDKE